CVFRLQSDWLDMDSSLPGIDGSPVLAGSGALVPASLVSLDLTHARPNAPCVQEIALASAPVACKGGLLVPFPVAMSVPLIVAPDGTVPQSFLWPPGIPSGTSIWFQDLIGDPVAIGGVAMSNTVKSTTP